MANQERANWQVALSPHYRTKADELCKEFGYKNYKELFEAYIDSGLNPSTSFMQLLRGEVAAAVTEGLQQHEKKAHRAKRHDDVPGQTLPEQISLAMDDLAAAAKELGDVATKTILEQSVESIQQKIGELKTILTRIEAIQKAQKDEAEKGGLFGGLFK